MVIRIVIILKYNFIKVPVNDISYIFVTSAISPLFFPIVVLV